MIAERALILVGEVECGAEDRPDLIRGCLAATTQVSVIRLRYARVPSASEVGRGELNRHLSPQRVAQAMSLLRAQFVLASFTPGGDDEGPHADTIQLSGKGQRRQLLFHS